MDWQNEFKKLNWGQKLNEARDAVIDMLRKAIAQAWSSQDAKKRTDEVLTSTAYDALMPSAKRQVIWWLSGYEEAVRLYRWPQDNEPTPRPVTEG